MLWQNHFIWSFLCLLMLDKIHILTGTICQPGQRATSSGCLPCPANQFKSNQSKSKICRNCDPCEMYSSELLACTSTSNTKCRCFVGFTPLDETQKRCRCDKGSGIKTLENGIKVCEKCPPKTSTDQINSECKLQPQYTLSSEKISENATTDVNFRNGEKILPSSPWLLSPTSTSTSTMTPTTSRNSVSTPKAFIPELQDSRKHALWLCSLAALLIVILILKLCMCPKKKKIVRQGSECGKPVEESGEKFIPLV